MKCVVVDKVRCSRSCQAHITGEKYGSISDEIAFDGSVDDRLLNPVPKFAFSPVGERIERSMDRSFTDF